MTKNNYRKRPVIIQAIKFEYTEAGLNELKDFVGDSLGTVSKARHMGAKAEAHILTLKDGGDRAAKHVATEGDWIIKGVQGEFSTCKPDIFEATYEKVV